MNEKVHILGLCAEEFRQQVEALGMAGFRADQVRRWVFVQRADSFERMTNLSKADRARLAERFAIVTGRILDRRQAADGVDKLLIGWPDGTSCETVMIPAGDRRTACLSSQVGCPVGCRFCASGIGGLARNLTAGEIVEQAFHLAGAALAADERITNVVFMGIGEPLANYDAVVRAIRLLNAADGFNVGARKITVSTVGLPRQIRRLAAEQLQITLAISLHAVRQPLRRQLIPWAARMPLAAVLDAARFYFEKTGREITFEYLLLEGVNSSPEDADGLADIAHSVRCNVNLICYNPVADLGFKSPTAATLRAFRERLSHRGVNAHIRPSRGLDIEAACGQLRRKQHGRPKAAQRSAD